jgi:hypothetical protein
MPAMAAPALLVAAVVALAALAAVRAQWSP